MRNARRRVKEVIPKIKRITDGPILREKIWIDPSKIKIGSSCSTYDVRVGSFRSKKHPKDIIGSPSKRSNFKTLFEHNNKSCFAGLTSGIKSEHNMVYTDIIILPERSKESLNYELPVSSVSQEEANIWIELAKEYEFLPDYIDSNRLHWLEEPSQNYEGYSSENGMKAVGTFVLNISDITRTRLYIYLSTLRQLREQPDFVKAVLYLVERDMNFYAAYSYAMKVCTNSCAHNLVSLYTNRYHFKDYDTDINYEYYEANKRDWVEAEKFEFLCDIKMPLKVPIAIHRFMSDPLRYDCSLLENKGGYFFETSTVILGTTEVNYGVRLQDLFDEDIIKSILSENDKEAIEHLEKFKAKNIKYIDKKSKKEKGADAR